MNRNIAYAVGVLAEHAIPLFQPLLPSFLTLLQKLHADSTEQEAKDNIVSAYCRIIQFLYMPLPPEKRPADYN